eukprot:957322-Amphidinium_carterae.1
MLQCMGCQQDCNVHHFCQWLRLHNPCTHYYSSYTQPAHILAGMLLEASNSVWLLKTAFKVPRLDEVEGRRRTVEGACEI